MSSCGARERVGRQPISERGLATVLRQTLPRRCNYTRVNYAELLGEAQHFGIKTFGQFRQLMLRHRRRAIAIDRKPFDALNERIQRRELGDAVYAEMIRKQIWFSWEGLTRLVFELELGERYAAFLRERYEDKSVVPERPGR